MLMFVTIEGVRLEYARLTPANPREGSPPIVLLHEALGSVSLWGRFPRRLAEACGCEVIVYSRQGHGGSDPATKTRTKGYLHRESTDVLPALLEALRLERPLLLGHSDGATIALMCAGETAIPLAGVVALAPHVLVEDVTVEGIQRTVGLWQSTDLRSRLARHHSAENLDRVFADWHGIWLDPEFRDWNVESSLRTIGCPVVAVQGAQDQYATRDQFERIVGAIREVTPVWLEHCGHSPHRDHHHAVIEVTRHAAEVARLRRRGPPDLAGST